MSRVVFTWEIGSGFGHITPMAALGGEFLRRGWRVSAVVPARSPARRMLEPLGMEVLDAPAHDAPPARFPLSINYAANLLRNGYWHGPTVVRRVTAWGSLLDHLKPDLLVADHSPGALLASRGAAFQRAAIGNGFTLPPLRSPMPSLQPWFPLSDDRLAQVERQLLDAINPVLVELAIPPMPGVISLFEGVERYLCVEPELDHYAVREHEDYHGAMEPDQQLPPPPVGAETSHVFAYLSRHNRFLPSVLSALRSRNIPTLAYVSDGAGLAELEPPSSPVRFLTGLTDLREMASRCRLAIIHGGTLTASLLLKQGTKLLICPQDLEKALLAYRLAERNLAWSTSWFSTDDDQPEAGLNAILASAPPAGVEPFVARYRGKETSTNVVRIADALTQSRAGGMQ